MDMLLLSAMDVAKRAHFNQKRKYTNDPYIIHPFSVAALVAHVSNDDEMLMAAFLHDTVEDTLVTSGFIHGVFGSRVGWMVSDLTDVSRPEDGNREARKLIDLNHTALASKEAKTIKLADLIDNCRSIILYDKNFAKVYMKEKRQLLEVLKEGNEVLYEMAEQIVDEYFKEETK
jgi:guanosine-3',5'-bis(diphosphate) 3'-pyrophosphohydrolase